MAGLDRDAAREKLRQWRPFDNFDQGDWLLDALEACVRPGPPHTLDRAAVEAVVLDLLASKRDDIAAVQIASARVVALLRPVEGVLLTREEAAVAVRVFTDLDTYDGCSLRIDEWELQQKLEAAL